VLHTEGRVLRVPGFLVLLREEVPGQDNNRERGTVQFPAGGDESGGGSGRRFWRGCPPAVQLRLLHGDDQEGPGPYRGRAEKAELIFRFIPPSYYFCRGGF